MAALGQERCDRVAARLTKIASAEHDDGLAGVYVHVLALRVDVWWHGRVPVDVQHAADHSGVQLTFHTARYTSQEMDAALRTVMGDPRPSDSQLTEPLHKLGVVINVGSGSTDGSKITFVVSITPGHPVRPTLEQARKLITAATKVRTVITVGPPVVPT